MMRETKRRSREEKCRKNTAVTHGVSIKQHDAATRRLKYGMCAALSDKHSCFYKINTGYVCNGTTDHQRIGLNLHVAGKNLAKT